MKKTRKIKPYMRKGKWAERLGRGDDEDVNYGDWVIMEGSDVPIV
jgi:hypothetical protein